MGRFATVNVRDYGATGDGVTNDYTAIAAALAASDSIYLPAGTYLTGSTIAVDGTKHIHGDGIGVSILSKTTAGAIMKVNSGAAVTTRYGSIRDLTISGSSLADIGMHVGQTGVSPNSVNHYTFDRLRFTGFDSYGTFLESSQINFFNECYWESNEDGVYCDQNEGTNSTDTIFRNCTFRNNLGRGVFLNGYNTFTFDTCTFESNDEEGIKVDRESVGSAATGLRIVRCYFEANNDGRGSGDYGQIFITATGGVCQDVEITDNYLGGKGTGNHHISLGLGRFRLWDNMTDDQTLGESTNTSECKVEIRSRYTPSTAFVFNNTSAGGTYLLTDINNGVHDYYHAVSGSWTQQTYTPSNPTTVRSYDCDSTSTAELADVLATLIADLQDRGLIG